MENSFKQVKQRIGSVDLLRGLVMVIMLLDHTREFVHADAFLFNPTDLSKTNIALFFTRWITDFCAPTFVFLAGISIYLQRIRGKNTKELAKFLLTRGIWLIVVEFTIVRFAVFFNLDYSFLGVAEVIWIFGVSMIVMAGLIYFPVRVVGGLGLVMIALHNLLDRMNPAMTSPGTSPSGSQALWIFLHQPGMVPIFGGLTKVFVAYPLIPWIGVMAAGYALGSIYSWGAERRRKWLLTLGMIASVVFVILRAINAYGDPAPWSGQSSAVFTFLSFLNTTKYPVSLLFLLMTLGPSLLVLGALDGNRSDRDGVIAKILITYGHVPLFYFILQMFVAHIAGIVLGFLNGQDTGFLFTNFPFAENVRAPAGFGFSLPVVYTAWITGVVLLYPLCLWYGNLKRRSGHWLFSYL